MYTIQIKNISGTTQLWENKEFAVDEVYSVPEDGNRAKWQNSSDILTAIGAGEAQVGDGGEYFASANDQINWLKGTNQIITTYALHDSTGLSFRGKGISGTAIAGTTTNIDYQLPENREFDQIGILLNNHMFGDRADLQFVDKDGVYYPAGTVLATFFYDYYFSGALDSQGLIKLDYTGTLIKDLYLRIRYYSTGVTDVNFRANLFLHKKT